MARPKTPLNKAAEQFKCPSCERDTEQACINIETGAVTSTHRTRQNLVCQETFLNMPATVISGGREWAMFCGRRTNHKTQHQTPDKRVTWAQGFGAPEAEALIEIAKTA